MFPLRLSKPSQSASIFLIFCSISTFFWVKTTLFCTKALWSWTGKWKMHPDYFLKKKKHSLWIQFSSFSPQLVNTDGCPPEPGPFSKFLPFCFCSCLRLRVISWFFLWLCKAPRVIFECDLQKCSIEEIHPLYICHCVQRFLIEVRYCAQCKLRITLTLRYDVTRLKS